MLSQTDKELNPEADDCGATRPNTGYRLTKYPVRGEQYLVVLSQPVSFMTELSDNMKNRFLYEGETPSRVFKSDCTKKHFTPEDL